MSYWLGEIIYHGETLDAYICLVSAEILLLKQSFKWKIQKSKAVSLEVASGYDKRSAYFFPY